MVDRTLSHYRILDRLGAGGMGEVYLAEDIRLGRRVALKLLPPSLTRDEAAKTRLIHEARAASLLDHPHICTVYDIEELPTGELLLAMAFCDGETLRTRLSRGPLPVDEAADLACQMADALGEAHAHGIVHRDVKPANAMVTKTGRLKLVDFGLAHLPEATMLTATGVAVGTPAYMAPEQVRGEEVDARADLFSLGVVLYEMATGTAPFQGATSGAVLGEILTKEPVPAGRLNPDVPPELERIIDKLLEKDREVRCQSARELRVDLTRLKRERESGRAAAAVAQLQHAADLDPTFFFSYWFLSTAYALSGHADEAIAVAEKACDLSGRNPLTLGVLGRVYGLAGRTTEARQLLEELEVQRCSSCVPPSSIAMIHRGLGDLERALEWWTRGVEEHGLLLVRSLRAEPGYDPLRSHPAYPALLRKMNLEP